nr:MAG TPA: hypothetical protein [Caudoviricetes sp.]
MFSPPSYSSSAMNNFKVLIVLFITSGYNAVIK